MFLKVVDLWSILPQGGYTSIDIFLLLYRPKVKVTDSEVVNIYAKVKVTDSEVVNICVSFTIVLLPPLYF